MIGARRGSPLAIGHGDGEMFFGSDALALAPFTDRITYLEDGDWAVLTRRGATIFDESGARVERADGAHRRVEPAGRSRQPSPLHGEGDPRAAGGRRRTRWPTTSISGTAACALPADFTADFATLDRLSIIACGTAFYAGLVAKYWFERFARLPVDIDIASEFRYREPPLDPERARDRRLPVGRDRRHARGAALRTEQGQTIAAVVNVPTSTIAREADLVLPTLRRARDRRRLDQGLHLPARGAGLAGGRRRPRARAPVARTTRRKLVAGPAPRCRA